MADPKDGKLSRTMLPGVEKKNRSWNAPLVMLIGLFAGTAFAVGHHFFYNRLNDQPVDNITISQTWVIRIGTLLAFLTKFSCILAVGTAYVQAQWYNSRRSPLSVQDLDALSSVLHNILSFFDGSILFHFPILAGLALIYWVLPIVPIITPGTINVVQSISHNITRLPISQPGFYNSSFGWFQFNPGNATLAFDTPVLPIATLSQTALVTGVTDQIISCNPTFLNSTYTLQFFAPVFTCQDAPADFISQIAKGFGSVSIASVFSSYSYLAWTPDDPWFSFDIVNATFDGQQYTPLNVDLGDTNTTRLYVMTNDGLINSHQSVSGQAAFNITECSLFNATYTTHFDFTGGKQSVTIQNIEIGTNVSLAPLIPGYDGEPTLGLASYAALAASLGTLLVGAKTNSHDGGQIDISYTSIDYLHIDHSNMASEIERLFHNIVLSAFCNPQLATSSALEDVAVLSPIQQYLYTPFSLVLTYALALSISLICSAVGMYAFMVNRSSYQNSFSSFLRATSGSNVHRLVQNNDTGADPRPKDLAKAMVGMNEKRGSYRNPALFPGSQMQKPQLIQRRPVPVSE